MQECWRWFGPLDRIELGDIAQTGASGIVTALHDIAYGEVWPREAIAARKTLIEKEALGLNWRVVESLPVHDHIKRGEGDLARLFANYRTSLQNLADAGIFTVCYNFMTVLDWIRTDHAKPLRGGGRALAFDAAHMAAFERHMLGRDVSGEYAPETLARADLWFSESTQHAQTALLDRIMAGLPGAYDRFDIESLRAEVSKYDGITVDGLRHNLGRFLDEVIPTAERLGMRLGIHPDDPPRPVFGLARIVSTEADVEWLLNHVDSPANGLTFCAGAFGSNRCNNLLAMARRFAHRVHFLHLRSVAHDQDESFHEAAHLEGASDLPRLLAIFLQEEKRRRAEGRPDADIPFRPDHGHELLSDTGRGTHPGYPLIGRLRGLAELRGVIAATEIAQFEARCTRLIADVGLGHEVLAVRPLKGGVASDIAVVDLPQGSVCIKFALPKLKVAADWFAPVHRNKAEYAWLAAAGAIVPGSVPRLLGRSDALNGFVMEFLHGETVCLWKAALLAGNPPRGEAARVAEVVGLIHARSSQPDFDRSAFLNSDDFNSLRIEPYLTFTARRHVDIASELEVLAAQLHASRTALVHGDISPKNILIRDGSPVILDAECATMGDPVFDVAFCLNHLILKSLHLPAMATALHNEARAFWHAYRRHIIWEDPDDVEARLMALLPALMLARVDGKSPVEYLGPSEQDTVRQVSRDLIIHRAADMAEFLNRLSWKNKAA